MARKVTVKWQTDDGDEFSLQKDMTDEELVPFMRLLENELDFEEGYE